MTADEEYLSEFRIPIRNFVTKLKETGKLSVLKKYSDNAGMKSDSRRKRPDNEGETFQYYLPLLCRLLGKYANDNFYHKDDGYYEFSSPKDNVYIHFDDTNHGQFAQTIKNYFKLPKKTSYDKTLSKKKLVAYTLYLWCAENGLSDILKESFCADSTGPANIPDEIYNELIDQPLSIYKGSPQPDHRFNDLFLLPNTLKYISPKEYMVIVKRLLSAKTGWSISSDRLNNLIAEEVPNIEEIQVKLQEIADSIISEAEKHPMYTYMIERTHYSELRELLKITSSYHEKGSCTKIIVEPPIRQIIQQISDWYGRKSRKYTKYTLLEAAGEFAASALGEDHRILKKEVIKSLNENELAQLYSTIYSDLESKDFKWITGDKFSIRQYRLVFWALGCAIKYNRKRTHPEQIMEDIQRNFRRFINQLTNSEHINWRFDDIICFTTALLHRLDDSIKIPLIEMLCTNAYDFSARNRPRQELAIHILTYLLCEDQDLPHDLRTKVFLSTYGQTMYKIQHNEWTYYFGC